jgi:hypothetical protein
MPVWIFTSHSGGYKELHLLEYDPMHTIESQPTFRRNISNPPSELKIHETRNHHEAGNKQLLLSLIVNPDNGDEMFPRNVK